MRATLASPFNGQTSWLVDQGKEIAMSAGLVQTYRAFAYNNAWANHRLLGACAELAQGEFEVERTGFFPSLQATLNHIYVVDLFYVDALEGGWLGPKASETPIPFAYAGRISFSTAVSRRLRLPASAVASSSAP
jgi:uncharacterized damage-inducible protein DinB